jgi:hypothetical protein
MFLPGATSTIVKQLVAEQMAKNVADKNAQAPGVPDQQEDEHQISSPPSSAFGSPSGSPQISIIKIPTVLRVFHPLPSPGKEISGASVDAFLTFTLQPMFKHGEWMILCIYNQTTVDARMLVLGSLIHPMELG